MPITFGTIGTNWITDSWISAAHKSGQWQLSAVYSRTEETASAFARKHQCTVHYTSLDDLAADSHTQAVYIASPNDLHYVQAQQFLLAKKHVILEKPAAANPAQLDQLFRLAKSQEVFLIEAFRHIQESNYRLLRRILVEENRLGPIYGASLTYASYSSRYTNVLNGEIPNVFSLDHAGGSITDIGVYPISFAVALFGKPCEQVYLPFITRTGVDGGGVIVLNYRDFGVQINQSKGYASHVACEVYGEKGTLTINGTTDLKSIAHYDPWEKTSVELAGECVTPEEKGFVNMLEESVEFARIITEKDEQAAGRLEEISRIVVEVITDMRLKNKIVYPSDEKDPQ